MLLVLTDLYENRSAQTERALSPNLAVERLLTPHRLGLGVQVRVLALSLRRELSDAADSPRLVAGTELRHTCENAQPRLPSDLRSDCNRVAVHHREV